MDSRSIDELLFVKANNVRDHRAGTIIMQAEKSARKPGFACITLLSGVSAVVQHLNADHI